MDLRAIFGSSVKFFNSSLWLVETKSLINFKPVLALAFAIDKVIAKKKFVRIKMIFKQDILV